MVVENNVLALTANTVFPSLLKYVPVPLHTPPINVLPLPIFFLAL